jgi:protease I
MKVLMPVAQNGFDPSEAGIPWAALVADGHEVVFATPTGKPAEADDRMVNGTGLGPLKGVLRADQRGRDAYAKMIASAAYKAPLRYDDLRGDEGYAALVLPGGHDKPMRVYLEAEPLQRTVSAFFAANKIVAAICHGVVLAARSKRPDGRSCLYGMKTTSLTKPQEMLAYRLTKLWLSDYYLTYPITVEDEVKAALADPSDYARGPSALLRDDPSHLERGFIVRDGHYLSARWPGDAHRFSGELLRMLR